MEEIWSKASAWIQSSRLGFFTSLQSGSSVSCQARQLDCIYDICEVNHYSQLLQYQIMGGFLIVKYFGWMRLFQKKIIKNKAGGRLR